MKRYDLIDTIRGLAVISMIGFHACWLASYFGLGISTETLFGTAFTVWERSICITFIIVAGFSFSLGRRHLRSGLLISAIGAAITLITCLFVPDIRIIFGVLTFIGFATLVMIPLDKLIGRKASESRTASYIGLIGSFLLFLFAYNINKGTLAFGIKLPQQLFSGYVSTFFGFMKPGFYSADYFSFIPWFFLYLCGYFIHKIVIGKKTGKALSYRIPGVDFIGRHSLIIYIIHPIVLYVLFFLLCKVQNA